METFHEDVRIFMWLVFKMETGWVLYEVQTMTSKRLTI